WPRWILIESGASTDPGAPAPPAVPVLRSSMKKAIYASPQDAESAFYEALTKADLDAMMSVWADDDDIYCVHPNGARLSGVEKVRESWRQIFAGGQTLRFQLREQQHVQGMMLSVHSVYE